MFECSSPREGAARVKKIAIVEDNEDNRVLVRAILEDFYALALYECGGEALEALRASPADLVLLDVSLPEMDGLEVLRRIRADAALRAIPVIALTAHAMVGDAERYAAAGFDGYVAKPVVDESVLLRAIERALEKS
jgi:CheY-like chemotaxis protein